MIPDALQLKVLDHLLPLKGNLMRGGIISNVDLVPISSEEREQHELLEKNVDEMQQVLDEAGDGTNAFQGVSSGAPSVVSKRQLTMTLNDVLEQRRRDEPVIPIYYDENEDRWVLPDEYHAAWIAGYLCQHCLGWQELTHHPVCNTVGGGSCGMTDPHAAEMNGTTVRHNLDA